MMEIHYQGILKKRLMQKDILGYIAQPIGPKTPAVLPILMYGEYTRMVLLANIVTLVMIPMVANTSMEFVQL